MKKTLAALAALFALAATADRVLASPPAVRVKAACPHDCPPPATDDLVDPVPVSPAAVRSKTVYLQAAPVVVQERVYVQPAAVQEVVVREKVYVQAAAQQKVVVQAVDAHAHARAVTQQKVIVQSVDAHAHARAAGANAVTVRSVGAGGGNTVNVQATSDGGRRGLFSPRSNGADIKVRVRN